MSHFAKIENGIVTEVIVAEQDHINTLSGQWVQTSYNTRGGVHLSGGVPLRKNFAGIGYIYDPILDAFYEPQPHPDLVFDEQSCTWKYPIPYPNDGRAYRWNFETKQWMESDV